jgi:hypothetical protein
MVFGSARESFAVDAVGEIAAVTAAVPEIRKALFLVASPGRCERPLGIGGGLGDDVDHSINRIRSPDGAAGSADDFDAIGVFEKGVLHFPIGAREKRSIHGAAVDQDQHGAREPRTEPPDSDQPFICVDAGHFDPWRQTQRLRDGGGARTPDVVAGDDVDGAGRLKCLHRLFRGGGDLELRQLLESEVL